MYFTVQLFLSVLNINATIIFTKGYTSKWMLSKNSTLVIRAK